MNFVYRVILLLLVVLGLSPSSHAQSLSWSSYDIDGNLVSANAGTGGDIANGSVSFTVGAGQTLIFVTQNFTPVDNSANQTTNTVTYNFLAQGLGAGNGLNGRPFGVGLFNTASTGGVIIDDYGYFALWNPSGSYPESYTHSATTNLFSGTQQGQGGIYQGLLPDNTTIYGAIRLRTSATGNIALGSGSAFPFAGTTWTDNGAVTNTAYINATAPPGGYNIFNQFAFYLSNTSASDETLTLDQISLIPIDVIPEPSTFILAGMGLLGLITFRRLRK